MATTTCHFQPPHACPPLPRPPVWVAQQLRFQVIRAVLYLLLRVQGRPPVVEVGGPSQSAELRCTDGIQLAPVAISASMLLVKSVKVLLILGFVFK